MEFEKLQDIIEFAIAKEQEAVEFYTNLAGRVNNDDVSEELLHMAAMEEQHKEWLQENSLSMLAQSSSSKVTDMKIADYVVEIGPSPDMTWHDIVNIAMHRESASMKLYNNLAQLVFDETARNMFEGLAAEEAKHKLYFEEIWNDEILIEN